MPNFWNKLTSFVKKYKESANPELNLHSAINPV